MVTPSTLPDHPWFFCGIGGSGMLPLAMILRGQGAEISGSDRSRDQGRSPGKVRLARKQGIRLFPQDGSGVTSADQVLVASAAVEDTVPEMVRAKELGCPRMTRAELLSTLFNRAGCGIAVGGTSGKSTVTGMLGWIMEATGRDPTIMNGAVMKNFVSPDVPFASARVGKGRCSFRSRRKRRLDRALQSDCGGAAQCESRSQEPRGTACSVWQFSHRIELHRGQFRRSGGAGARSRRSPHDRIRHRQHQGADRDRTGQHRRNPGRHRRAGARPQGRLSPQPDAANAGAAQPLQRAGRDRRGGFAAGVKPADAVAALGSFRGLARRFDIIGTSPSGITVIDDFGHNPEKCAATLRTLKSQPGRVIAFFQPHGYGPLRQMGHELAQVFAE